MSKTESKRYKLAKKQINKNRSYELFEGLDLAKKLSKVKFDETIEMVMRLNVNPKHADQQIRGSIVLPEGTGKTQKVLVLTTTKEEEAIKANADYVGGQDLIDKITQKNWFDFDTIIATPEIMPKLGKIGRVLGPKGLMPNPKTGTVTTDVKKAINDVRKGKLVYRVDKDGNMHFILGKVSFETEKLANNFKAIFSVIKKARPNTIKGEYIKNISISTSMGPGIRLNPQ